MRRRLAVLIGCLCVAWVLVAPVSGAASRGPWTELAQEEGVPLVEGWTFDVPAEVLTAQLRGAVVADGTGALVPVRLALEGDRLTVTPVRPYERGSRYSLRLFLADGRRYVKPFITATYPKVDTSRAQVIEVPAWPEKGFNYPYLLFVPASLDDGTPHRLLVEPNNSNFVSDDPQAHLAAAREQIKFVPGRAAAEELRLPLLVPAFPRPYPQFIPEKDGIKAWVYYVNVHSLTRSTLLVPKGNPLYRVDLQLLAMIEDAKALLAYNGIATKEKIFLEGFSAGGKFTNRFTLMHPKMVRAVASGGVGGLVTIPLETYEGKTLYFPVGIADLKAITGIEFDLDEYRKVAQLIHWGDADTNDPVPFLDCYDVRERDIIWSIFGHSLPARWAKTQSICAEIGISAQFVTYKGVGHEYGNWEDVVAFFRANDNDQDGITPITPTPTGGG